MTTKKGTYVLVPFFTSLDGKHGWWLCAHGLIGVCCSNLFFVALGVGRCVHVGTKRMGVVAC